MKASCFELFQEEMANKSKDGWHRLSQRELAPYFKACKGSRLLQATKPFSDLFNVLISFRSGRRHVPIKCVTLDHNGSLGGGVG